MHKNLLDISILSKPTPYGNDVCGFGFVIFCKPMNKGMFVLVSIYNIIQGQLQEL